MKCGIVAGVTVLLLISLLSSGHQEPEFVVIKLVGLTNYPGQNRPTAIFVATNLTRAAVHISHLAERKSAAWPTGWPVYGPDLQAVWASGPAVPPRQTATLAIPEPDVADVWRVRFMCSKGLTEWQRKRASMTNWLRARKWFRLANFLSPMRLSREIVSEEIKL